MNKLVSNKVEVGSLVRIPRPKFETDTWTESMSITVDDITEDGTIMFCDDEWNCHEISMDRVEVIY